MLDGPSKSKPLTSASEMRFLALIAGPASSPNMPSRAACEAQNTFADIVQAHAGNVVANQYRTPWNLSDPERLLAVYEAAGLADVEPRTVDEDAVYPSVMPSWPGQQGFSLEQT